MLGIENVWATLQTCAVEWLGPTSVQAQRRTVA
jgi:hypothetical protein